MRRSLPVLLLWLALPGVVGATEPGDERAASSAQPLTVLVTGDVSGRLARLRCAAPEPIAHEGLAAIGHALAVRHVTAQATATPSPLLLDAGNLLGTDGFGRFIVSQVANGPASLAAAVAQAGYDAVALGAREMATPDAELIPYLATLRRGGVHVLAANLACSDPYHALCGELESYAIIERGALRIGVVGVVGDDALDRLPKRQRARWQVTSARDAAARAITALRAAHHVDAVILLAPIESERSAPRHTLALARELDGWDVMVGGEFAARKRVTDNIEAIRLAARGGWIVGTARYSRRVTEVSLSVDASAHTTEVGSARSVELAPHNGPTPLAATLARWAASYCATMDVAVNGATFPDRWTEAQLRDFAVHVMRESCHAELAALDHGHLRPGDNVLSGRVTRNILYRAFPYGDAIGTVTLKGSELDKLVRTHSDLCVTDDPRPLATLGVGGCASKLSINGRPLDPAALYRVATTSFIAEAGGDYLAAPLPLAPCAVGTTNEPLSLRELVTAYVERLPAASPLQMDRFADLASEPLWVLSADAQLGLDNVDVYHPHAYESAGQPQLLRTPFTGQSYRASARAYLDTTKVSWQSRLDLTYATSKAEGAERIESADLVRLNSIVSDLRWKRAWHPRAPVPYVEGDLETELTRANPYARTPDDFRHLLLTGTGGMRSELLAGFDLFVGLGARREVYEPDSATRFGLQAGYRLLRSTLAEMRGIKLLAESSLDYFRTDPFTDHAADRVLWTNRLSVLLFDNLTTGLAVDGFGYREAPRQLWGTSLQVTWTLGAAWGTRLQTF